MDARTLRAAALAAVAALSSAAHGEGQEDKLRSKLAQPFVGNVAWVTDYEVALETAKKENKLVFAYFTRSYYP
ncbi:MAG: hypothetical protein ACHQ1G_08325 [Planctomycetota bacterium]